nr:putative zinc finger, CCHC-type [Tanacetum cinerariifolium]
MVSLRSQTLVRKGFSEVDTPLFKGMIVAQQADDVADKGVARVDVDDVLAAADKSEKVVKKQKLDEEVKELKKHLQIVPNYDDDVYTKDIPLALKVLVVEYEIYTENNKPYFKIIRADGTHQLFMSFLSLLRNFDREDLEVLWQLVKEIFASSKPKNFLYDFLLTTLIYMFEKSDVQAQMILMVERRYPLISAATLAKAYSQVYNEPSKYFNLKVFTRLSDFCDPKFLIKIEVFVIMTNREFMKDMTSKFDKLVKFDGQDFRCWQKKMHFLLTTLKVVYVLSTPSPVWSEDETLETTRKRMKWENDDYICRGHILNGMSDSLFGIYQNAKSAKALWESLESKYMAEDASATTFLMSGFMNYKIVDTSPVMEQYHEMLRILGQYTQHNLMMDEAISVAVIIDKLPPS